MTSHFKQAHIVLLVFDLADKASFEALGSWLALIQEATSEDSKIFVVGNKADLDRTTSKPEAMAWCLFKKCKYFQTSALRDEGLKELMAAILETLSRVESGEQQLVQLEDEPAPRRCCL